MNNKILSAFALLAAPWMQIGFYVENEYPHLKESWFTGIWGLIFMTGWMFSVRMMQKAKVAGEGKWGRWMFFAVMTSLTIANFSNIIQVFMWKDRPFFFFYIDLCWPLSNVLMIVLGTKIIVARKLQGWKRFVPFFTSLWLPFSLVFFLAFGRSEISIHASAFYSTLAWSLLAIVARSLPYEYRFNTKKSNLTVPA